MFSILPPRPTSSPPAGKKHDPIKEKIEANRTKRLAIARAMKAEAGVTGHEVLPDDDFSGLAVLGTNTIHAAQGRNMRQLYTLAHECGHIFLHQSPAARRLATHVMEMEAESYAHQAFREHGMEPPKEASEWGRQYVAHWIARDHAAGIPIDARAVDYALGRRSPFEPLRRVPATWRLHRPIYAPEPEPEKPRASRLSWWLFAETMRVIEVGFVAFYAGLISVFLLLQVFGIGIAFPPAPEIEPGSTDWYALIWTSAAVSAALSIMGYTMTRGRRW
ncbi:MAG: hypothetical protein NW205_01730 [Hyphomicrobiaceae bacterium]|nr:hypothetical protein [Hyphomicrobiaceae bacterium]